ncbi:MAG: DUF4142 domain-containing protein [Rufibacter sp.]
MKKLLLAGIAGIVAAGTACSRIDTSTSNTIPTTNAYEASMRETNAAAGVAPAPINTAMVNAEMAAGTMWFENRELTESAFLMESASTSILQIKLGEMAQQRTKDPEIKSFAEMMIDHHTKTALELYSISSGMGITLPSIPMPMHQALIDKLSKLRGSEFDEEYMDSMEELHEREVAKYEVVSNNAPTTSVKAYAIRTAPILRVHLNAADKLEDKVD